MKTKTILQFISLLLIFILSCKDKDAPKPVDQGVLPGCVFSSFKIGDIPCTFDQTTNTFYYPLKANTPELKEKISVTGTLLRILIDGEQIENFSTYEFENTELNQPIDIFFGLCDGSELNAQLKFTHLPIIHLQFDSLSINNEPKQAVPFQLYDPNYLEHGFTDPVFHSTIGIETRGGSSRVYPKKSYGFELWLDESGIEKFDAPLLGMRNDDDWILDAMYIDIAKMRNRVSTDIWLDMSPLHYQDQEPTARFGIQGKLIEVFIDQEYHGLYFLNERMDRKHLQLKKSDPNDIKGLLYKASFWGDKIVKFENYYPSDPTAEIWDGWEQKHPDPDDFIHWQPLDEFVQFVVDTTNTDFNEDIGEKLLLENAMDYFILLNLTRGDDNAGKNIYFARYKKSSPFFMVPWDLDATWGRNFIGSEMLADTILSNSLFDRLLESNPDNFRPQLKQRWFSLRGGILSNEHIKAYFDPYMLDLNTSGAFERDNLKWNRNANLSNEKDYINNWIDSRLLFLDDFYMNL